MYQALRWQRRRENKLSENKTRGIWGGGTRLRTDGIKAMSRDFSGGKHVINFSKTRNRGRVCLFLTAENEQLFILKTIMANYG